MGFLNIFPRPQKVLPDSDFADLTTTIVIYQHDEEFAEPGMPDPVVPVLSGRLVPKRGNVGVLQKRSCVVWLLCYSNHIDNATGETKWQRNK